MNQSGPDRTLELDLQGTFTIHSRAEDEQGQMWPVRSESEIITAP